LVRSKMHLRSSCRRSAKPADRDAAADFFTNVTLCRM
jgi:hypothetical protein